MTTPKWEPGHLYLKGDLVQPLSAVAATDTSIPNAGFESGDDGSWTKDAGWTIANVGSSIAFSGDWTADCNGPSGEIIMATGIVVAPGTSISAYAKIKALGDSGNGALVFLEWYDNTSAVIRRDSGNGNNSSEGHWENSSVTGVAPANTATVKLGVYANIVGGGFCSTDQVGWNYVTASIPPGLIYKAVQDDPGHSDSVEPVWPLSLGVQVVDNEVIWEAVQASRVTYEARPILKSGTTEPTWPTTPGVFVSDGTISWECISRRIEDENCPNTKVVHILAGKVFAVDDDIIRFCATANPLDWTTPEDAGYLPSGLQSANGNGMAVLHQYRGNLGAFNANCFQNWQADPNPAAMAILDQIDGIGSTWPKAAQAVANDLLFLSQRGVRSVGIAAGAENLAAGDVGIPIDVLVQDSLRVATANDSRVLSTHYPGAGQYWLVFPDYPAPELSIIGDLPDGYSGDAVSYGYTIVGGVLPYASATVATGALPDGLSLDTSDVATGTIRVTDTRTTAGIYPFSLSAIDADGSEATLDDTSETLLDMVAAFDGGSTNKITAPISLPIIATGDFTVEGRFSIESVIASYGLISGRAAAPQGWVLAVLNGTPVVRMSMNGGTIDTTTALSGGSVAAHELFHFAWTREGDVQTIWLEGVAVDTMTEAGSIDETDVAQLVIGSAFAGTDEHTLFGHIDWLAVTIGTCRYTDTFTPPLGASEVAGASVALDFNEPAGSVVFADTGSLGLTWTVTGSVDTVVYPF